MRRRSPTNSRPLEDIPLRHSYLEANWTCEFHLACPERFGRKKPDAVEVHHIFSVRQRPDLLTNVMATCRDCHELAERQKTEFRLLAIWWKAKKGEFDPAEFHQASGYYVEGWVLSHAPEEDWALPFRGELLRRFP